MPYLLTFSCYGLHLPGDARGWVERARGYRAPSKALERHARELMSEPAYRLDEAARGVVLEAIREVCAYRHWTILAAHVRSTHVHCVVDAEAQPNRVIADFKAYSSRALNRTEGARQRWAREGSTRR